MRPIIPISLALVTGFLVGCGEQTTSPTGAAVPGPQFDHKGVPHGKGGGKDGPRGNKFAATIRFRDGDGDRITSDGGGPYTGGLSAEIKTSGELQWNTGPRVFNVDLSDQELGTAGCEPDDCRLTVNSRTSTTGALLVLASQDNGDELPGHLLGMAVGQSLPAMLRTGVMPEDDVTFQLFFQHPIKYDLSDPINDEIAAASSFLSITRTGDTTWTIEALVSERPVVGTTDDWAIVISESGKGRKNTVRLDEGSFHVPFGMTVTCATCPGPGS